MRKGKLIGLICLLSLCNLVCAPCSKAQTASEVLSAFLLKTEKSTLRTEFSLTVADNASQPFTYSGTLEMRGERFLVSLFGTEAAYDGRTLYVYSEDTDELTLSAPSEDELTESNPLLFAKALQLKSSVRFSAANKNTRLHALDIIPEHKEAGVNKIVLKIDKESLLPVEIRVYEGSQTTTVAFRNAAFSDAAPRCTISKPDAFLNDLR